MVSMKKRYMTIVLLLVATAFVVNLLEYDKAIDKDKGAAILSAIPLTVNGWRGRDFALDEQVYDILETRAIVHRSYTSEKGDAVFLSIVHYHDTKLDFHAPEACLGGRGYKTRVETRTLDIASDKQKISMDVSQIITKDGAHTTLTYYFFKSGQFLGSNYFKMRLNIAANKFVRGDTRGSLIRVSTDLKDAEQVAEARSLLVSFIEEILPYLKSSL